MSGLLSIPGTVREAYAHGLSAGRATWLPHLFFIAAAAVAMALAEYGALPGLLGLCGLFAAGLMYSLSLYRAMMNTQNGTVISLALANLAVYAVFVFIGFLIGFFLAILPGFLLIGSGHEINADTPPGEVQEAVVAMMAAPAGLIMWAALIAAGLALCFLALRLSLIGAATVEARRARVFETWPWTKGQALRLGAIALATHVLPFAVIAVVNQLVIAPFGVESPETLVSTAPERAAFAAIRGAAGALILPLFLLPGHGMAVAVYRALRRPD